ncbi:protein of unknown function [Methylocella tundrae]|uniref:Uncharacterized protein n=1 Tax=Methylocella tundrae TaxID=227605 RepID=A0A4U8Z3B6_METTU|nr:protein of unknown function [Methylocella tundrae]
MRWPKSLFRRGRPSRRRYAAPEDKGKAFGEKGGTRGRPNLFIARLCEEAPRRNLGAGAPLTPARRGSA